jgi:hypothetical protein
VLSSMCLPQFRPFRGVVSWLVALALICAPLSGAIGATVGALDPGTKVTKLVVDVDNDGADACLYCGARCHCQHTMDGPQSGIAEPDLMGSAVVRIFEPAPRPVPTGAPDRPPKT